MWHCRARERGFFKTSRQQTQAMQLICSFWMFANTSVLSQAVLLALHSPKFSLNSNWDDTDISELWGDSYYWVFFYFWLIWSYLEITEDTEELDLSDSLLCLRLCIKQWWTWCEMVAVSPLIRINIWLASQKFLLLWILKLSLQNCLI